MSEFASNTPLEHKDRWQTPIEVFAALDLIVGVGRHKRRSQSDREGQAGQ